MIVFKINKLKLDSVINKRVSIFDLYFLFSKSQDNVDPSHLEKCIMINDS